MAANTNLVREKAVELIKGFIVVCPKCDNAELIERRTKRIQKKLKHGARSNEYKCPFCGEIYHLSKLI